MYYDGMYTGIENSGIGIKVITEGFGSFSMLAGKYLVDEGLGTTNEDGNLNIDPDQWYPVENFRRALFRIAAEVGDPIVTQVGEHIPDNAVFPPNIKDIESALASLDAAMHLGHRKNGHLMFNPSTGYMEEGIGHLGYQKTPGRKEIIMTCSSPYPCTMDKGLITAMARRFQPGAKVVHDRNPICKDRGGPCCRYIVTW